MPGTKFGCGIAQCGACTVHVDGQPIRSCIMPVVAAGGKKIMTIEAIGLTPTGANVQKACLDLEVAQCGYCQSGQIMSAAALLAANPHPSDADIDAAMAGTICRCGTYARIRAAIKRAAEPSEFHRHVRSIIMGLERPGNVANDGTGVVSERGVSRRTFLKVGAAAGGGLLLSFLLPGTLRSGKKADAATATVFPPNAFVRIGRDDRVTLIMPYVEMGQGTYTSIPMPIAEELEVDLGQVTLEAAPPDEKLYTNPLLGPQATGGSLSVRAAWEPLRRAGATARMMLVSTAAQTWLWEPGQGKRIYADLCTCTSA